MRKKKKQPEHTNEPAGARPFWSGTISFGLVSVPVNLYTANRDRHVGLRMLGPDDEPLHRRYYSAKSGKELSDDDLIRGYEQQKGRYVTITDDELERLAPEQTRDIDLRRFVDKDAVQPEYFERGYFLLPAGGSNKAYRLLAQTMERNGRTGIATFVMHGKAYLIAIVAENGILRAETMRFADELRSPKEIGLPRPVAVTKQATRRFSQFIARASSNSLPSATMRDNYAERLEKLVQKKQSHRKNVIETEEAGTHGPAQVIDIMEVLKKSLKKRAA